MQARTIRISESLHERLRATADDLRVDVSEVVRRALRRSMRNVWPVVFEVEPADTTLPHVLRLVDLRDVADYADNLPASDIRDAINAHVQQLPVAQPHAFDTEPGWTLTDDGTAMKKEL